MASRYFQVSLFQTALNTYKGESHLATELIEVNEKNRSYQQQEQGI